mmetsp:Transcript_9127/g.8553  ORF Transcript_9127/g.8553 Transcript_9127/m.8553 type:complete len:177 (+) Transcript_9127:425-955(+)
MQYYDLLKSLLEVYFLQMNTGLNELRVAGPSKNVFDNKAMLKYLIDKLCHYQSSEKKNSVFQDYTLSGIIELVNMFIENSTQEEKLTENEYAALLKEVLEKLLFTFQMDPYESHILKNVDLSKIEKPHLNKCQSSESRNAAYALLITLIKELPGHVGSVINDYWHPMLWKVKKPKK